MRFTEEELALFVRVGEDLQELGPQPSGTVLAYLADDLSKAAELVEARLLLLAGGSRAYVESIRGRR